MSSAGEVKKDIRDTPLYQEAEAFYRAVRRPGSGLISDAAEISARGGRAVFAGAVVDALVGEPSMRICLTELDSGSTSILTRGPNSDRCPKLSPDGRHVAFVSDRLKAGEFQLCLIDLLGDESRQAPSVDGWVEYIHWSPDGQRILLGVAGYGADSPGAQGATARQGADEAPSWIPSIAAGEEPGSWRSAWVYELESNSVRQLTAAGVNVWEGNWAGNRAIAAITSPGTAEGLWYTARLQLVDIVSGASREVYAPRAQIGWPSTSPSGRYLAFVEALCSDRWLVCGELRLVDLHSGVARSPHTGGMDISYTEWISESRLLVAGHREFSTAVGIVDANGGTFVQCWHSEEISTAGLLASVSGTGEAGDFALVGEGFRKAPEIAVVRNGNYRVVRSFDLDGSRELDALDTTQTVSWRAPDGLEIQGLLLKPHGDGPHPTVMMVHGGPVWHYHPYWPGRRWAQAIMLLRRGCAIFLPNPRGSTGRGQEFVRPLLGDMGGADTMDYLSGMDCLVHEGLADPKRLGVTGASYGGYMTCWLITQDHRFAAAVATSPVTNFVTVHLMSNIPHFVSWFLDDSYRNAGGRYFQRSPINHAHKVRTPILSTSGALDRCTPPQEALQFHNAMMENGGKSVLVTYPEEGHGVRKWPALIDLAARSVGWLEEHLNVSP
jgi:dipeptidyl aminopeptidase/acylaminoacyl peptidase